MQNGCGCWNLLCLFAAIDSVESAGVISPDDFSDLNDLLQRAAVVGYPPLLSRESETHSSHTDVSSKAIFQCYRRWKTNAHAVPFTGTKMSGQIPKEALGEVKEITVSSLVKTVMLCSCALSWLYYTYMQICDQHLSPKFLLEKPYRLIPPSGLWGSRRQFRKRGGNADCFWKYCVWAFHDTLNRGTGLLWTRTHIIQYKNHTKQLLM